MSTTRLVIAAAFVAVGLVGERAAAQGDERLRSRLDARTAAAVQEVVDAAAATGLPDEPLILKALEGASKGARGPLIAAAVGRLHTQLGVARSAIGGGSSADEIVAAASALQAGVDPETLRRLRVAREKGTLTVPLSVLADLVARGVPASQAAQAVLTLVGQHASDHRILEFQRGVERDIVGGTTPAAAAVNRVRPGPPAGLPVTPGAPPVQKGTGAGRPPAP